MTFQQRIKGYLSERSLLILGVIIITTIFLPYLYWGENSHVRIHDNLDSNIVWAKMVLDQGGIFLSPSAIVEQPMRGLPHSSLYGSYDISLLLFSLFGTFWGYIFNKFLMAFIGFFGMYLLLKRHFLPQTTPPYIAVLTAVCFSLLPFWSFTASVAGLPLILYAFLNIRQKDTTMINWLIILFYGFYSSLILAGVFFLIIISAIFIYDIIRTKSINISLLGAIILLCAVYIINHLPLFISHFANEGYISHRTEFKSTSENPTKITIERIWAMLRKGDGSHLGLSHAVSLHRFIVIPIIVTIILMIRYRFSNKRFISILIFIIVASCLFGIMGWDSIAYIKDKLYSVFPMDFRRFYWLLPLCWYILLGLSLAYIAKYVKYGHFIIIAFLIFQFGYVVKNQDYIISKKLPTYKEFYAEQQFNDIKDFINKDIKTYRVVSIGIHPSISQYNGFYTLDGFSADYPLKYKHEFGRIIEAETNKSQELYNTFTCWGSWCYAFSSEIGIKPYTDYKNNFPEISHLDFNYQLLKSMGGDYIISAAKIDMENNKNLRLLKTFAQNKYSDGSTNWDIYLYEVLSQPPSLENNPGTEPIHHYAD